MVTKLRVGFVGLGLVAQVVHLPVLRTLEDQFEVVSGCDLSLSHAEAVAARHGIPSVYSNLSAMLAAEKLDVVAVLNSDEYHAEAAIAALEAGCHVLLEKPICLNLDDAAAMIAARDKAQRKVMVGYMRRQAVVYRQLKQALAAADIHHVSMRALVGPNAYFNDKKQTLLAAGDIPADAARDRQERAARQVRAAIGEASPAHVAAYRRLNTLCSHDFSALRGLVGRPRGVIGASCKRDGRFMAAILDYGSFTATYETGGDYVERFDARIEILTGGRCWRIEYDTPYVSHLPTRLLCYGAGDEPFSLIENATNPYTIQWQALWRALVEDEPIEASLEDAIEDVKLAVQIVRAFEPVGDAA